jgi:hypothetical protein
LKKRKNRVVLRLTPDTNFVTATGRRRAKR